MSGILGIVRFGAAAPAPIEEAAPMARALAPWGDAPATLTSLGGAVMGQLLRPETPEDEWSAMPIALADRDLLVTAEGRLDNRDEVIADLGLASPDARTMADSTLLMHAYLAWGEQACTHLYGDWSFAAWHPAQQRLVLARDHHGNTPLVFHHDRSTGRILFASDARALYAAGVPRRLNELKLAQGLVSWNGSDPHATIDLDIDRVPPAHIAVATVEGVRQTQYWSPRRGRVSRFAGDDAERLLAALDEATRARCRSAGGVATTLSGGLDSGSVTVLAARHLHEAGGRLTSYTNIPIIEHLNSLGRDRFGDERILAGATARAAAVDDHVLLDSARVTPIQGIHHSLDALDRPSHAASNAFWIHDILQTAHAGGQRTLLTGQSGNATISWTGRTLAGQLAMRWHTKGVTGVLGYFAPAPIHRRRAARGLARENWENSAIDPGFAGRLDLANRMAAGIGRGNLPLPRTSALDARWAIVQPGYSPVGDIWGANGAYSGLDVRDPTADPRVIEASFAIPDSAFRGPDGMDRWALRSAMRGLLPDEVRLNPTRGQQSSDLVERLRRTASEVEDAFGQVTGGPAEEYVSLERMRAAWIAAQHSDDLRSTHRAGTILLRGMMAALWIDRTYR